MVIRLYPFFLFVLFFCFPSFFLYPYYIIYLLLEDLSPLTLYKWIARIRINKTESMKIILFSLCHFSTFPYQIVHTCFLHSFQFYAWWFKSGTTYFLFLDFFLTWDHFFCVSHNIFTSTHWTSLCFLCV